MMTVGALHRVPIRVHWYHTLSTQIEQDWPEHRRFRLWLLRQRAKLVYRMATHAVANSLTSKQDLMEMYAVPSDRCTVFWNSLEDPALNLPLAPRGSCSLEQRQRFVCVGRLHPCKGQDVLLRAVAIVAHRLPQVNIEFVGDGPNKRACERLACDLGLHNRCAFVGEVPHLQALRKMAEAWATIVPSRAEAFGLVNIESMAVGTPVVGSAIGGIAEIVRDRLDGLLFPAGDHEAMAQCIIELAENTALRGIMSANAHQRYLDCFEMSRAVEAQAHWLHGLIQDRWKS